MDVHLLIDAIVRQTTVLIAQLATSAGARATLAHTANQVFIELVRELRQQGLGAKAIADMFGLSLRTYHNTVRRLSESNSVRGQTLWEAVLDYIRDRGTVFRSEILTRFTRDDDALVRSVLKDLVDSGALFQTGRGAELAYRVARPEEFAGFTQQGEAAREALVNFVWISVYRRAPVRREALLESIGSDAEALDLTLQALLGDGRIEQIEIGGVVHYSCQRCIIPIGADAGWEASIFDHYQAMVTAITSKLRSGGRGTAHSEATGGSTYSCDVWDGHPLQPEALGYLRSCRERGADLVRRVDAYNATHARDAASAVRVYAYVGQSVIKECEDEEERG